MSANTLARFLRYHNENPHVYDLFVDLARQWRVANPNRKIGINALVERVRWELGITTDGEEEYLVNNSFAPYYSRMIAINEEDLRSAFELRHSEADGVTLYSDEDSEETDCPKYRATVDVPRARQRAIMSRDLLPEARILAVMADLGETVCKERLYKWLSSGRLQARGYLHGSSIVEHRISSRDARLLSLSTCRQLRWAEETERAAV